MTFVNEYITPEDNEKYGIDELNKLYQGIFLPMASGDSWTIDRERDCYLRFVKLGRICEEGGEERISYFSFYWNGVVRVIRLLSEGGGSRKIAVWAKYYLKKIDPPLDDLNAQEKEIFFEMLREGLTAFRDFGVLSKAPQFEASFDF